MATGNPKVTRPEILIQRQAAAALPMATKAFWLRVPLWAVFGPPFLLTKGLIGKETIVNNSFPEDTTAVSDAELKRQRENIRRRLTRANTAAVLVLLIVIGLAVAAIFQALRAERNAEQAGQATRRAEEQLWQSQLARARAQRLSGLAGRKGESLSAVSSAAAIRPSLELRDEAIAA